MKNILTILLILISSIIIFPQHPLPTGTSILFSGSGNCILCHSSNGDAMTWNGIDVSPITYWRSTMMGNASKDPLWRAMVAEEVHKFPQLQETIESTCTKCHSPMGYTQAIYNGQPGYSMAELKQDPLANDGVSCTVCHQIKPGNFGSQESYSGNYIIEADSILYGPYENSDTTLMPAIIGYTSAYGPHLNQSELCATCHTLFTPFIDNNGNVGGYFPEQTPYLEWKNSIYPAENTQCQDCHMPKIYDPIVISGMGNFPPRTPFWFHSFVGGNVYMLNILKNNIDSLNITAEPEHFDSTIARAGYNLTEKSLLLSTETDYDGDSLIFKVKIENITGHKLPTGIPFRRIWVHLKVEEIGGAVIFESGEWNNEGKIINYNSDYEPHYNVVTSEDQVQVYEGAFVDVDQQVTYTLLRAAEYVKDNRIPPKGFTTSHISYDSTGIFGAAIDDTDFNKDQGNEGTGSDIVTYKIPVVPNTGYRVSTEICYQSVKPELIDYIRTINQPDITRFVNMYDAIPNVPIIMKESEIDIITGIQNELGAIKEFKLEQNYPNPFNPSTKISWQSPVSSHQSLKIYDLLGREVATLVDEYKPAGSYEIEFDASELSSGAYLYTLTAGEYRTTKKLMLLK